MLKPSAKLTHSQKRGWLNASATWRCLTPHIMTRIYMGVLLSGVTLSAILTPDRKWWHAFFSVLGGGDVLAAHIFNGTLIVSGVLLAISGSITARHMSTRRSQRLIEWTFWGMGLGLIVAGIVPYSAIYTVHYLAANVTALAFTVLALSLQRQVPTISNNFVKFNYTILAAIALMYAILYGTHLITMTVMEVVIGALFLLWLERFIIEVVPPKPRA